MLERYVLLLVLHSSELMQTVSAVLYSCTSSPLYIRRYMKGRTALLTGCWRLTPTCFSSSGVLSP